MCALDIGETRQGHRHLNKYIKLPGVRWIWSRAQRTKSLDILNAGTTVAKSLSGTSGFQSRFRNESVAGSFADEMSLCLDLLWDMKPLSEGKLGQASFLTLYMFPITTHVVLLLLALDWDL